MKTEAFGKALLPRPQSMYCRYHSTNGHAARQVGLLEDRVLEQEHKCKVDEVGCE